MSELQEPNLGDNLIFIISLPRSGSTLLQHIIGSHSQIASSAEPWVLFPAVASLKEDVIQSVYDHKIAQIALKDFFSEIPNGEEEYYKSIRLMTGYLYNLYMQEKQKSFFLDKTSRYHIVLPEIYRTFPRAKFIFLFRNPLATLKSFIEIMVSGDILELANPSIKNDLLYGYQNMLDGIELIKDNLIVNYEQLIQKTDETVHTICDFLGISFESDMINYGQTVGKFKGTLVDPKSIHKHDKPVSDYLDVWKTFFEDPQMNLIASGFLEYLGEETYTKLGYSYKDDLDVLRNIKGKYTKIRRFSLITLSELMNQELESAVVLQYKIELKRLWQRSGFFSMLWYVLKHPFSNFRLFKYLFLRKK